MNTAELKEKATDELESLTERISRALERGKFTWQELQGALGQQGRELAESADDFVHDKTWTSIGLGAGVGFVAGVMVGRMLDSDDAKDVSRHARRDRPRSAERHEEHVTQEHSERQTAWLRLQALLPLVVMAMKTYQEMRGGRGFRSR